MEFFQKIAEGWHTLTGDLQEKMMPMWTAMLEWPIIGVILAFLETTFGRGVTPL